MKMTNALTRPDFDQYQTENMDPALAILGVNLTKFEKRKQVAARLLGYSSYEALVFNDTLYDYSPIEGELLVSKSPHLPGMVLFIYEGGAVGVSENYGTIYAWDGSDLTINTLKDASLSNASEVHEGMLQFPFEQSVIDLGFHGPKLFNIGILRQHRLRVEFDWIARNGMIYPLIVKAHTKLSGKPSQTFLSRNFFISFELPAEIGDNDVFTIEVSAEQEFKLHKPKPYNQATDAMVLWELSKMKLHPQWSTSGVVLAESLDCVKIAYAFLDAQQKTKTRQTFSRGMLKKLMEKWAGRYISADDVNLAIKMHPELQGDAQSCNVSTKLVFPSYSRLDGIKDTWSHDYRFTVPGDQELLNTFSTMETLPGGSVVTMDIDEVISQQQKCSPPAAGYLSD